MGVEEVRMRRHIVPHLVIRRRGARSPSLIPADGSINQTDLLVAVDLGSGSLRDSLGRPSLGRRSIDLTSLSDLSLTPPTDARTNATRWIELSVLALRT